MSTTVFARTYAQTRTDIARLLNDLVAEGTVINPTTTTINALALVHQRSDQLRGKWLYINGGAQAQVERAIYAFTPISPATAGSGGRIDVLQAFSAAPSTNSTFEVYQRIQPTAYNSAILRRIRVLATKMLVPKMDHSIVANSKLYNGTFQQWNTGVTLPDGWTAISGAAISRLGTQVYPGLPFSANVLNTASSVGGLQQAVMPFALYSGLTATFRAVVHTLTSGRVRLRIDDGVNQFNSGYHDGNGDNELVVENVTLAVALTQLLAQVRTETGTAINSIVKKAWLTVGNMTLQYPLNPNLIWIERIEVEADGLPSGTFVEVPNRYYYVGPLQNDPIMAADRAQLVFLRQDYLPTNGKVLRIIGQSFPGVPSAETDNLEVDPQAVVYGAAAELLAQLPWGEQDSKNWRAKYATELQYAADLERRLSPRPPAGGKLVRPF